MNEHLSDITLKLGERVRACVVRAPDADWRESIMHLLAHKEDVWRWQIAHLLSTGNETGVEGRFYLLHRDGTPFCNIMTVEFGGVGLLGHVWTCPEDRLQGAASAVMNETVRHFRARGGQALYLGTGFDSAPFHLYRKFGFEPFQPRSGAMRFCTTSIAEFEAGYFASGNTEIVAFSWPQWAVSSALLTGDSPGIVRNAPLKLLGRILTEGPLMPLLREETERKGGESPRAMVLQKTGNGAVVGLAAWDYDPLWPATCCIDVWCHPLFWNRAGELMQSLAVPEGLRLVAFSDTQCHEKAGVLKAAGFHPVATLPRWVSSNPDNSELIDVIMWEKS